MTVSSAGDKPVPMRGQHLRKDAIFVGSVFPPVRGRGRTSNCEVPAAAIPAVVTL